jgi:hypothetical protein
MNIFHLHKDPKTCAEYHCDKHVVKMIVETAQMLSTAYRRHFNDGADLYKTAYPKHPMTIWVGDRGNNFQWSLELLDELLYQYKFRYEKEHRTKYISDLLHNKYTSWQSWDTEFTPPPLCMPDKCKHYDYITAYRIYYVNEKNFATYTKVATPHFMC